MDGGAKMPPVGPRREKASGRKRAPEHLALSPGRRSRLPLEGTGLRPKRLQDGANWLLGRFDTDREAGRAERQAHSTIVHRERLAKRDLGLRVLSSSGSQLWVVGGNTPKPARTSSTIHNSTAERFDRTDSCCARPMKDLSTSEASAP